MEMIKNILQRNRFWCILMIMLAGFFISVFWLMALRMCVEAINPNTVRNLVLKDMEENLETANNLNRSLKFTEEGVFLVNSLGEAICGPFKVIEIDDMDEHTHICRFIGDNGLIGYVSAIGGEIIIAPQYTEASKMEEGTAFVSEGDGIFYISENGERITEKYYMAGYNFAESRGRYARVQTEDGSWSIINRKEEILLSGCEWIHRLPDATSVGSAVRDGCALLYAYTDTGLQVIKQYEEFSEISSVYMDEFAVVKNREGLYGAVCGWNGDVIIPADYKSLDYELVFGSDEDIIIFKLQNCDGLYEILVWKCRMSEKYFSNL